MRLIRFAGALLLLSQSACQGEVPGQEVSIDVDQAVESECNAGEPQPSLQEGKFSRDEKNAATESFQIDRNTRLVIEHFGCAHFAERYIFSFSGSDAGKHDMSFRLKRTADILRNLPSTELSKAQHATMADAIQVHTVEGSDVEYIPLSEMESMEISSRDIEGGFVVEVLYQVVL